MRREGVGGFCSVATGDIAVGQGASASLIAHEWAHSLDGRLGQMVLESGSPLFDADGGARILSRPRGSYDALCSGLDALEFNPGMPKGSWSSPCEILARAVERHTSRGVFENAFRLLACAATPSSKAQAERFKASWSKCLALAGVEQRPAGMRLTSSAPQALLSCSNALLSPVSALAHSGAQWAARLARRHLGQKLSTPPNPRASP